MPHRTLVSAVDGTSGSWWWTWVDIDQQEERGSERRPPHPELTLTPAGADRAIGEGAVCERTQQTHTQTGRVTVEAAPAAGQRLSRGLCALGDTVQVFYTRRNHILQSGKDMSALERERDKSQTRVLARHVET